MNKLTRKTKQQLSKFLNKRVRGKEVSEDKLRELIAEFFNWEDKISVDAALSSYLKYRNRHD